MNFSHRKQLPLLQIHADNKTGQTSTFLNVDLFVYFFIYREDMYSQDSIDLLQNSGLQFKKHEEEGIDTLYFAELLMTSGLVLCENVRWLSFHR